MQQIQASHRAFAATLGDGSVVTWGGAQHGGDSSAVQDQLSDVLQRFPRESATEGFLGFHEVLVHGFKSDR